ncbi:unnamed protein product, partial [Gulo gulo]
GVQQAAVHRRGALRHRREQVRVQGRLPELLQPQGGQPQLSVILYGPQFVPGP